MSVILKNNTEGFLATAISASDTGLVLQSGNGANFPNPVSPDYFYATLVSAGGTQEVVRVTARSGDSMTIVRAQDSTTAQSFAAGSRLEMRVNAQSVIDTVYGITNYQGASSTNPVTRLDGSALQAGDFYFNTVAAEVRFFNGTAWQSLTTGSIDVQNFSGNGSTTNFTLSVAPTGEDNTQVYVNGVYQQKDTYSISGTTLIFSIAPPVASTIEVVTLEAIAIGQTSSDLVTYQPAGVSAVPTTVREKLRETVSVKDFGAVGDGVTDDTAAIQESLDYAISLQPSGYSGGSGGIVIDISNGNYITTDTLSLAPASGVMSDGITGEGRASAIIYDGAALGTALVVKNNNNNVIEKLTLQNSSGESTITGLALQTTTSGSSSTSMAVRNVDIRDFAVGLQIGSTSDNATSELLVSQVTLANYNTAVNVQGNPSGNTNSISLTFDNVHGSTGSFGFRYSGTTTNGNNRVTLSNSSFGATGVLIQLDSALNFKSSGMHTEGNPAGWKYLQTAVGAVACPPMIAEFSQFNNSSPSGADWAIQWAGNYSFKNVYAQGVGLDVGDVANGNRYHISVDGSYLPVTHVGSSVVYVDQKPTNNSYANNQSVCDGEKYYFDKFGVKYLLESFDWSDPQFGITYYSGIQKYQHAEKIVRPAYGTSITIDARLGCSFEITATDGVAFLISAPIHCMEGQRISIRIKNTSGGVLGTVSFASQYKTSGWTSPADGYNRTITFEYAGSNVWYEISQSAGDVPN